MNEKLMEQALQDAILEHELLLIAPEDEVREIWEHAWRVALKFNHADAVAKLKIAVEALQSAPVGEIRCDASTGHVYGVYWYESAPSIGTKVYINKAKDKS